MVKQRSYLTLIVLGGLFLVALNLPSNVLEPVRAVAREAMAPYHRVLARLTARGRDASDALLTRSALISDRNRLSMEVADLRRQVRRLTTLADENAELRRLLDVKNRLPERVVVCEVVGRGETTGWWETLQIDGGSQKGLAPDMPVITEAGILGVTTNVTPSTADVLLLCDVNFSVGARFPKSGVTGVLRGGGVDLGGRPDLEMLYVLQPLQVDYVPRDTGVEPGEEVVTSGLGGIFPADLPIGRVKRVLRDASGLYQRAEVLPAADLAGVRRVMVITDRRLPAGRSRRLTEPEEESP